MEHEIPKKIEALDDEEFELLACGASGYASVSVNGRYYKLVDDRSDRCSKLVCSSCGGGLNNHAPSCQLVDEGFPNNCRSCKFIDGHPLTGMYCTLRWKY